MYTSLLAPHRGYWRKPYRGRGEQSVGVYVRVYVYVYVGVYVRVHVLLSKGTCGSTGEREEGEDPNDPPFVPNRPLLPR